MSSIATSEFQSTRPRGARRSAAFSRGRAYCSFNPRAHVGRDWYRIVFSVSRKKFQSTRPRGARHDLKALQLKWAKVSIHAPTWGATLNKQRNTDLRQGFNPRAHVGRDMSSVLKSSSPAVFQSTRPRGARQSQSQSRAHRSSFNPRAHVGRDSFLRSKNCPQLCFNPRAHVGRDYTVLSLFMSHCMFQSTRPRGARLDVKRLTECFLLVSIHAPTWGATFAKEAAHAVAADVSIHAPTWGATV